MMHEADVTWGSTDSPLWQEATALALDFQRRDAGNKINTHKLIGRYMTAVARGDWAGLGELVAQRMAEGGDYYCHFGINHLLMLAAKFPNEFPPAARDGLRRMIEHETGPLGAAYLNDFECENDNFPFMAVAIQIVGGDFIGCPAVVQAGLEKLRRYSRVMAHYGVSSEFCSPNYTSWQIGPLSLVAALAQSAEARRLARGWIEFLWFEIAQRWHHGLRQLVGPHSRAYQEQIAGGWSHAHTLMRRVLGTPLGLDPELMYRVGHTEDNAMLGLTALGPLYCPGWVRAVLTAKKFPLTVEARGRVGWGWDGAHAVFASEVATCSHLAERFSLASASRPWNAGWQSNTAIAYWNLSEGPPRTLAESRVAYSRTLLDDHGPLRANRYVTTFEGPLDLQGGAITTYFQDDGLNCAVQQDNVVLLAARPKWLVRRRHAIRHTLLISDFANRLPELYANGQRIESLPYRAARPEIVTLRDGSVVLGLRPLEITDYGRGCALEIHRESDHIWISYWNYQGPERLFSMEEMHALQNGYVWIVDDAAATTPVRLHERLAAARVEDRVTGLYRTVAYDDGHVHLAMKIHQLCPDPHLTQRNHADYRCPVFSSPYVQGGYGRDLMVGEATLEANAHPLFLRGDPTGEEYAVYNFALQPAAWRLKIGAACLERQSQAFGRVRIVRANGQWQCVEDAQDA